MNILFQGDMAFISAQELLEWLEALKKTCKVTFTHNGSDTCIFMKDGSIIYATCDAAGRSLSEFLVERGVMKESELVPALTESRDARKSLNRHLIESGHVTSQTLTNLFGRLVEQILAETILYRTGSFSVAAPIPDSVLEGPVFFDSGKKLSDVISQIQAKMKREAIESLNERLLNDDIRLPVLPKVAAQLRALLEDETSSMQSMTRIIMSDQIIASGILKVANSPFYAGTGQTDSVNLAVSRIGARTALAVVTAIELKGMQLPDVPREKMQAIVDDALKSAFIASGLAMQCYMDPEQAFLGGLLHDLGKTVILSVAAGCKVDSELLHEFINDRHAEVGALIAHRWNYPENLQSLIRCHHDRLTPESDRMIAVLQIADGLVEHGPEWAVDPELIQLLGLNESGIRDVGQVALQSAGEFSAP